LDTVPMFAHHTGSIVRGGDNSSAPKTVVGRRRLTVSSKLVSKAPLVVSALETQTW